jgi:Flp pilus assembly protein TadG
MKKFILSLIAVFMLSSATFASNVNPKTEEVKIELATANTNAKQHINLKFTSVEDFNSFNINDINDLFTDGDKCEVTATVTVTGSVSVGVASVEVSVSTTITASCSTIKAAIEETIADLTELVTP